MTRLRLVALLAVFIAACSQGSTEPGENIPAAITVVAGSSQTARVNSLLPGTIRLLITDPAGRPVSGVHVKLDLTSGEGDVGVTDLITDGSGSVFARWTLGPLSGMQTLVARVANVDSAVVQATATGCDLPECPEFELVEDQAVEVNVPTFDQSGQVVHPDVVQRKTGTGSSWYWMAVTPYPNGNSYYENPSIFRGINGRFWRIPKGLVNPVVWPGTGHLSDPDLTLDGPNGVMWMYYRLVAYNKNIIMLTKSNDGISWSKPDTVFAVASHNAVSPTVVHDGPHAPWQMWTVNSGPQGCVATSATVQYRQSTDGLHWGAPRTTTLTQPGKVIWHIDVRWVPARAEYWALYTTFDVGTNCSTTALYLARSSDGINWEIPWSPIYRAGGNPYFKSVVYRSSFLTSDDAETMTIWLSGANVDGASLIWSAATTRRRTADLFLISNDPTRAFVAPPARLLPIPEPWDMPGGP